jgi:hypothetical protein
MFFQFVFIQFITAHAILEFPTSRKTGKMSFQGTGVKISNFPPTTEQLNSCLDSTATAPVSTFSINDSITVTWKITIPHQSDPGVRIAFQSGTKMVVVKDNVNVNDLKSTVQIPKDLKPGNNVLQWIWASKEDGGFYMACSDITIQASTVNTTKSVLPNSTATSGAIIGSLPITPVLFMSLVILL